MVGHAKKTLIDRLDNMAEWTGIPQLHERSRLNLIRRRRMRWLPIAALLMATTGMAAILLFPNKYWLGLVGLMMSQLVVPFLAKFGPLKPLLGPFNPNPFDVATESEKALRRNAYLVCFAVASGVALLGILLLIGLTLWQDWPRNLLLQAMAYFFIYIIVLIMIMPTLFASWAMLEPVDGADDFR